MALCHFLYEGAKDIYNLTPKALMQSPLTLLLCITHTMLQSSILESAKSLNQWNYEGRIIVNNYEKWIKGRSNPKKQNMAALFGQVF